MNTQRRIPFSHPGGFTLIELMIAMVLFVAVGSIAVKFFVSSVQQQPKANSKSDSIRDSRALMESIGRDMRSGVAVTTAGTTTLAITTYVHQATCAAAPSATAAAIQCRVTYTCTSGTCTRKVENPGGGSPGTVVTVVTGLSPTGTIFTYSPSTTAATFVQINLVYPAKSGEDEITLTDGFSLRNEVF